MTRDKIEKKLALVGNPNTGKTTIFNQLTGLKQQTGNYPGITIDKKTGNCKLCNSKSAEIIDLPGTYSLHPSSPDESVVYKALTDPLNANYPDEVLVIADATNLHRNMFLLTQVVDLGFPIVLVLNMIDLAEKKGIKIDILKLELFFGIRIVPTNARTYAGIDKLKNVLCLNTDPPQRVIYNPPEEFNPLIDFCNNLGIGNSVYAKYLITSQESDSWSCLSTGKKAEIRTLIDNNLIDLASIKSNETLVRYSVIHELAKNTISRKTGGRKSFTDKLDRILTHRIYGYLIFIASILIMFQSIFALAAFPQTLIEQGFDFLIRWTNSALPEGVINSLICGGIIPGLGAILSFVPQIAVLFLFIGLFEESGYMSRAVFLTDKIMRRFGLNGKSIVPLISGAACAIPAIMATRNIENRKERLITLLVTPLTPCAARLPVYTIIIALVIPDQQVFIFNMQGLVLMAMYLLGFATALLVSAILSRVIKSGSRSPFIIEMPSYKMPLLKNIAIVLWNKVKYFVINAGRVIFIMSIVLWVLASSGPSSRFKNSEEYITNKYKEANLSENELETRVETYRLENSYIGIIGKAIEPAIEPIGYDWKIGIALISSLAAREVFVGTMATLYSVGSDEEQPLKKRMKEELNPVTGLPRYDLATGLSLLVFYAFAMQCVGTIAIIRKETNSWLFTIVHFLALTGLAYVSSLLVYSIFS